MENLVDLMGSKSWATVNSTSKFIRTKSSNLPFKFVVLFTCRRLRVSIKSKILLVPLLSKSGTLNPEALKSLTLQLSAL
ncbi:hypothetical protein Trydic_g15020 [Trypoxylus dichotomus]